MLRMNRVDVGRNLVINGRLYVRNHGTLRLGDNVTINSGIWQNPVGGHPKTVLVVCTGAVLNVGSGVGISNSTIWAQESITIGDGVLVGGGCNIWDTDFHSLNPDVRGTSSDRGKSKPVHIGEMAFVGALCIVLKGSHIGRRSIVGAGSVASFDLADDEKFPVSSRKTVRLRLE